MTVIGILKRGPQVGAAVSYPQTCNKNTRLMTPFVSHDFPLALSLPLQCVRAYLCVVHAFSQSHGVDADVDVTTLVHELQIRGALHPRCCARERQVQLQGDALRVVCVGREVKSGFVRSRVKDFKKRKLKKQM